MSKLLVLSVYDSKVEAYMAPWYARARGEAIRSFEEACNDGKSMMSKHPGDYTLFQIGEFDEKKGELIPLSTKVNMGVAIEFRKAPSSVLPSPLREASANN